MHRLRYNEYKKFGIIGDFTFDGDAEPFMVTLSHAYQVNGTFQPIVLPGMHHCKRGIHALEDGIPFETFEIDDVQGHTGLLFVHPGNFQKDSKGCTLCGEKVKRYDSDGDGAITDADDELITNSRATFATFMARMAGIDEFTLEVV